MSDQLCFQCFRIKGDYEVCPWCGYTEDATKNQAYQLTPGTILEERYIIGAALGIGGFGITYKAYDTVLSVVVAIKEFYPARLVNRGAGEEKVGVFSGEKQKEYDYFLSNFQKEAEYMAKFSKEKDIVNIYNYVEANETAYIVMEYIDDILLKERLAKSGKLSVEEATDYTLAILDALEKVHYHGLIHKDVSPDNIFLTGDDTIKLADFGAARLQGTKSSEKEEAVIKVGYTPPEQYQPNSEQGVFMDIYAVGAVFYEMLTGEKPQDAMDRQIEDLLESPGERGVKIEPWLDRIVMKAMAVKPKLRFQTAEQFKNAIISKKRVDLPEEELRKKKRKKKIMGIVSAGTMVFLVILLILSQTVFSAKGKIDAGKIEKDTIRVWLLAETEDDQKELAKAVKEDMKEKCPKITLDIETMTEEEYVKRIAAAGKKKELPEVFCTDGLSPEEVKEYCEELTPLMNTMNPSSYLFLEDLSAEKMYELPTAFQVGVVYVNENKVKEIPESYTEKEVQSEIARYMNQEGVYKQFQKEDGIAAIAGDLSAMDEVKAVTVDIIPPTDFEVVPVVEDQKLIGCFENRYGVNKSSNENRKKAAMIVLSSLVSDRIQSIRYMDNYEGIPINKSVYEDYQEYKTTTYLSFFKDYGEENVLLQGRDICEILQEK